MAILAVCKAAGISRGTFYRYFSAQDELLDALVRHKREGFHRGLVQATLAFADPDERFDAFIEVLGANDIQRLQDIIARMYTL